MNLLKTAMLRPALFAPYMAHGFMFDQSGTAGIAGRSNYPVEGPAGRD
ncbi:MAG: hypothetical protein P8J20_03380 [Novosphingobium sp.]|nr:hypothetical protein [Novosphingobium sp.]